MGKNIKIIAFGITALSLMIITIKLILTVSYQIIIMMELKNIY